jgi:tRNA (guanine-N7-)-methyltransferase
LTTHKSAALLEPARLRVFYGRRQGRALRQGRRKLMLDLLPDLAIALPAVGPLDPARLFAGAKRPVWLEIGFGGGEHLAWQAGQNPGFGFIGAEVFLNGIASALAHIEKQGLKNVRLFPEDARLLIAKLQPASIARVFLLFPDPWPKKRHEARRFVNRANLDILAAIMEDAAELRIASDDPAYIDWIGAQAGAHPAFHTLIASSAGESSRPLDWPATRYEEKALAAGRRPSYFRFHRIER